MAGDDDPSAVHLELHKLGISALEQFIKEHNPVLFSELDGVVVIPELHAGRL